MLLEVLPCYAHKKFFKHFSGRISSKKKKENKGATKTMAACWQLGAGHLDVLNPGAAVSQDLTELSLVSWLELFEAFQWKTIHSTLLNTTLGLLSTLFSEKDAHISSAWPVLKNILNGSWSTLVCDWMSTQWHKLVKQNWLWWETTRCHHHITSHHIIILTRTWKKTFTNNSNDCKCSWLDCKSKSSHLSIRFQRNKIPKWLQIIPDWDQHWPWVQHAFGSTDPLTVLLS